MLYRMLQLCQHGCRRVSMRMQPCESSQLCTGSVSWEAPRGKGMPQPCQQVVALHLLAGRQAGRIPGCDR